MSIILKGIDMPKENEELTLEINHKGEMRIYSTELRELDREPIVIQIPKGHGRVGDLDLLKDMIKDSAPAYGIGVKIPTYDDMDIMDKIEFVPTILEAEEER